MSIEFLRTIKEREQRQKKSRDHETTTKSITYT